jgi:hypothetical protein
MFPPFSLRLSVSQRLCVKNFFSVKRHVVVRGLVALVLAVWAAAEHLHLIGDDFCVSLWQPLPFRSPGTILC